MRAALTSPCHGRTMSTHRSRILPAALALALAAGLTACGSTDDPGPGVSVESPSADAADEAATSSDDPAASGDLFALALAAVSTAEREAGGAAYGLDDLDDDDRAGLEAATTTLGEAVETALAEVGGTLDDVELDEEDGTWVWSVSVDRTDDGDDVEVHVDAATGEVVRVES